MRATSGTGSYATEAGSKNDLPVAILGSGSDYTVFFNHLGIASGDLTFDGPYGVYHSVYDSYHWMATQGDPGFLYHATMAKLAGLLALRFANADLLPFDPGAYGREIARYAEDLAGTAAGGAIAADLAGVSAKARAWSAAASAAAKSLDASLRSGRLDGAARARGQRLAPRPRARAARRGRPAGAHLVPPPDLRPASVLPRGDAARDP